MRPKDAERERTSGERGAYAPPADGRTRAVVVVPVVRSRADGEGPRTRSPEARLAEAVGLAAAINLDVVSSGVVIIGRPRPATLIGAGKVAEIGTTVAAEQASLVVVDHPLSPIQQRNLERAWNAKVLDRTGLILEIFGERAHTREGALQVELAHLNYQRSRLVRSWTHLERQRGGFGFLGGPGETQIEQDRRLIGERIQRLERELEDVKRTRRLHRASRRKVPHPVVALVGYTNAGKSTLFNRLSGAGVLAEDLLFATLDPTLRRIRLPHGREVILSDTVGFISDLPTHLVAAFRATLEEVIEADVILHVRDMSHEDAQIQASDVAEVLTTLGVDPDDEHRVIEVWNKIDLLAPSQREALRLAAERRVGEARAVAVSAVTGEGLGTLLAAIERKLAVGNSVFDVTVATGDGSGLAWLHEEAEVLSRRDDPDTGEVVMRVRVAEKRLEALRRRFAGRIEPAPNTREACRSGTEG